MNMSLIKLSYNLIIISKNIYNHFIDNIYEKITYLYCCLKKKPILYIIGDSHVKVYKRTLGIIVHHIGPATMFNLNKDDSRTRSKNKLWSILDKINKKNKILLVFGEIDARIHIFYQYKKNNEKYSIEYYIDKTIENYLLVLKKIKNNKYNFAVHGIVPASRQGNRYKYKFYPTQKQRIKINKIFNDQLRKSCDKYKYLFFDIYPSVVDKLGTIKYEYAADEVHLNCKARKVLNKWINSRFS